MYFINTHDFRSRVYKVPYPPGGGVIMSVGKKIKFGKGQGNIMGMGKKKKRGKREMGRKILFPLKLRLLVRILSWEEGKGMEILGK